MQHPLNVPAAKPVTQPFSRGYIAVWAGMGSLAALYLGTVVFRGNPSFETALVPVTETLERLANDIAELKQTTAALSGRQRSTAERVTTAETRIDGLAQAASRVAQADTDAAGTATPRGQRPTNRAVLAASAAPIIERFPLEQSGAGPSGSSPPATKNASSAKAIPQPAVVVSGATINPIRTGSVAPTDAPLRPQGVLIASGPSVESVRLSWSVLRQGHAAVLGALEPKFVPANDGTAFNLIAGPFTNEVEAQKACATLKAKGVGCKPADFAGAGF